MWRRWLPALIVAVATASCAPDWRTDMWYQPSVRTHAAPRPPPERSVPLGAEEPYADREATIALANPVAPTPASILRGRAIFVDRCAPCHGLDGHGHGPVSRLFPQPADLVYAKVRARSDGFLWGTITYGGEAMPPAREALSAAERWDVVNYVRYVQGAGRDPP